MFWLTISRRVQSLRDYSTPNDLTQLGDAQFQAFDLPADAGPLHHHLTKDADVVHVHATTEVPKDDRKDANVS